MFFGTVFPLLSEAVSGVKVSVGAPVLQPGQHPRLPRLLFLMGVGPLIAWRRASADNLRRNFLIPVIAGIVAAARAALVGIGNVLVLAVHGAGRVRHRDDRARLRRAVRARRRTAGWLCRGHVAASC